MIFYIKKDICGVSLSIVVKVDIGSSLEVVIFEVAKLNIDKICSEIISVGIGNIFENDIKLAIGSYKAIIVGFNVNVDVLVKSLVERNAVEIKTFNII